MMNGTQYVESLEKLHPRIFYRGKRLESPYDHPALRPHIRTAAATYDLAADGQHDEVMTATSNLDGAKISRF
ncbi:MAG TPA: 4-hydroxyphenylacetate 3-hydroxylase N-terminal domain-containing protein, partial [Patescibacteria group bacterium]|nr:4-hydroxyphenylacetate 3-hydroxylase N-terminal domain-containing protein [Patescibacteria group bacterium]